MKTIKFRGKCLDIGKFVYGDLVQSPTGAVLINERKGAIPAKYVAPETVAQFVGYDKSGKEVYEGDKLTDKYGYILTARLRPQAVCNNEHIRFDWMPDSCNFELKEK